MISHLGEQLRSLLRRPGEASSTQRSSQTATTDEPSSTRSRVLDRELQRLSSPHRSEQLAGIDRLGKLGYPEAGGPLASYLHQLTAADWYLQKASILVLGACGHVPALPMLRQLASEDRRALVVNAALGRAILQLSDPAQLTSTLSWGQSVNTPLLLSGMFEHLARTREPLAPAQVAHCLDILDSRAPGDDAFYTAAIAAVDWHGDRARAFLDNLAEHGSCPATRQVAQASLSGGYTEIRGI